MKRALAGLLITGSLAGCGGGDETTTVIEAASTTSSSTTTQEPAPELAVVDVGEPVVLTAGGTDIKLAVDGILDPLPAGQSSPAQGARYLGLRLTVENTGDRTLELPLDLQSVVITSKSKLVDPVFAGPSGECADALATVNLTPGTKIKGCLPFEVANREKAAAFQFGGGDGATVEWDLTTATPVSGTPEGQDPEQASSQGYLDCVQASGDAAELTACNDLLK